MSVGDWFRLMGLLVGLPIVAGSIRINGVFRTQRRIERLSRRWHPRVATAEEVRSAEALARLAGIAGRRGAITATCLRQALLVYGLLRRRGLSPELRIGVKKNGEALDAHAWVELGGVALGQSQLGHTPFQTTAPSPAAATPAEKNA